MTKADGPLAMRLLVLWLSGLISLPRLLATSSLDVSLPRHEPGTRYNARSVGAAVKLEVFLDLNCPDSLTAWPDVEKVGQHYDVETVDIVIHQFPLPYHDNAFLASQGFYLVKDFVGTEAAFKYMSRILENYSKYSNSATANLNKPAIKRMLADDAAAVTPVYQELFTAYIDRYRSHTTSAWKYAAGRGVAGTPWYFINGVDLGTNSPLSYDALTRIIDSLINN